MVMGRQRRVVAAVTILCSLQGVAAQYDSCTTGVVANIGNGQCDAALNIPSCGYDGDSVFNCLFPGCDDATTSTEDATCVEEWLGDGGCDVSENNASCGYDGGDVYPCGSLGFDCQDPAYFDPAIVAEFPRCTGDWILIGDGMCNPDTNVPSCGYDGAFDCLDPDAGDELYECEPPPPASLPCSAEVQREWVVDDAAQAEALSAAVNCSGGLFEVEWRGTIIVDKPINVADGTSLTITGASGSMAAIDGSSSTRLFSVVNAALHLDGLNVSYGASTAGGAIAASGSTLTFNRTNFVGNTAIADGGAVYVSDASSVSCGHGTTFVENRAGTDGGAMFAAGGSEVSCGGSWLTNSAGGRGGALRLKDDSSASWSEESFFESNTAGLIGGALSLVNSSRVSWDAPSGFNNNYAGVFGGALFLSDRCTASWQAGTAFFSNSAGNSGGSVFANMDSNVSWNGGGNTVFDANQAGAVGGAFVIIDRSHVSWSGDGNTLFDANQAGERGGAFVILDSSHVSWGGDGNTLFDANQAGEHGGALAVYGDSQASCSAGTTTTFSGNSAIDGGAVWVSGSNISFSGSSSFQGNGVAIGNQTTVSSTADSPENVTGTMFYGGAVFMVNATALFDGPVTLTGNGAHFGGAVYVSASNVQWNAPTTTALYNTATLGGAIYIALSSVTWNGQATIAFNDASESGGGVHMINSSVSWVGEAIFSSNVARLFGGALLVQGNSSLAFDGSATFVENRATSQDLATNGVVGNGGAVNVFGNSSTVWRGGMLEFIDNVAGGFGSALFLRAGSHASWSGATTRFVNNSAGLWGTLDAEDSEVSWSVETLFESNNAFTGGAIFLGDGAHVGWTGETTFSSNQAASDGGAVASSASNEDSTLHMGATTTFLNNTSGANGGSLSLLGACSLEVDPGVAVSYVGNSAAVAGGAVFVSGAGTGPVFFNATFVSNSAQVGGAVSVFGSGNLKSISETEPPDPTTFVRCRFAGNRATTGGAVDSAAGHDDIIYSTFEDNMAGTGGALRLAGTASIDGCSFVENFSNDGEGAVVSNIGTISSMVNISFSGNGFNCPAGMFLDFNVFTALVNVSYPAVYQSFLDGLNVFNFDLSWILSAACVVDVDFHDRLLVSTVGPILVLLFLGCTYATAVRIHRGETEILQNVRHKHVSLVLLLTFIVYSSVSSVLFSTFACDPLDDGKDYLRSDYRIECDSPKHKGFKVYAGFMIVVYTVGIPAFYAGLLFKDRDVLRQEEKDRGSASRVSSTSDLWEPYKPSCFYYEVIECARRVLLAGVVVFIYPNSAAQIAITLMIAFAFVLVSEGLTPYASRWDHWISRTGHVVVVVSMYVALLLKVDVSNERSSSQKVFEAVLVAVHAVMVSVVVVETVVMGIALRAEHATTEHPEEDPCPHRTGDSGSRSLSNDKERDEEQEQNALGIGDQPHR
eukprot:g13496.t1